MAETPDYPGSSLVFEVFSLWEVTLYWSGVGRDPDIHQEVRPPEVWNQKKKLTFSTLFGSSIGEKFDIWLSVAERSSSMVGLSLRQSTISGFTLLTRKKPFTFSQMNFILSFPILLTHRDLLWQVSLGWRNTTFFPKKCQKYREWNDRIWRVLQEFCFKRGIGRKC